MIISSAAEPVSQKPGVIVLDARHVVDYDVFARGLKDLIRSSRDARGTDKIHVIVTTPEGDVTCDLGLKTLGATPAFLKNLETLIRQNEGHMVPEIS